MSRQKSLSLRRVAYCLLCAVAFLVSAFDPLPDSGLWARKLIKDGKINLPVQAILQEKYTSCGEAAFVMAFNYAYPENPVEEVDVIKVAAKRGYFTESKWPFTSPENMVELAQDYADTVSTGVVTDMDEGLALLKQKLMGGDPVIIDVLVRFDRPNSGAHFIVVTGIEIDPNTPYRTKIYFNDPLMGKNRWAYWHGSEGLWNAWQYNGDPGGAGWWMIVASP